jgi:hypothetical protein
MIVEVEYVGFRPHRRPTFLAARKVGKRARPKAPPLGQQLSVRQPTRELLRAGIATGNTCPRQTTRAASRKLSSLTTAEPGASAMAPSSYSFFANATKDVLLSRPTAAVWEIRILDIRACLRALHNFRFVTVCNQIATRSEMEEGCLEIRILDLPKNHVLVFINF